MTLVNALHAPARQFLPLVTLSLFASTTGFPTASFASGWIRPVGEGDFPIRLQRVSPSRRFLIREDLGTLNSVGTVYTLPGWFLPLLEGDNLSRFGVLRVICVAGLPLAPALERGLCGVSNKTVSVSVSVYDSA